ncbi:50S ribosome-binding GTPase, partial [Pseudomonadales bacterium]|nr:50S ribosome-binding GTPase [Pseudomonadales bacterium]
MTLKTIGLLGNPNCGKSTLFNRLTGANQRVGNWPGVTVERKTGSLTHAGERFEIIDLPGIYSLDQSAGGMDEAVARDYIAAGDCDFVINIVDASNLQRHLILTQQLLDSGLPVVIALNMLDVAERAGLSLDPVALSDALNVPVVPMIASRNVGVQDLLAVMGSSQNNDPAAIQSKRLSATGASSTETLAAAERRYHKAVAIGATVTR